MLGRLAGAGLAILLCAGAPLRPDLDLGAELHARSPWRLEVENGPAVVEPSGDATPVLRLCLRPRPAGACDGALLTRLTSPGEDSAFADPHALLDARVVRPRGEAGPAVLLITLASAHAVDGGQVRLTQALAYRPGADRFERVYALATGTNNDQEVRYMARGRMAGDIVSAEPTQDAPYAFWITVNVPDRQGRYHRALRYRSATRYGDGDPLAVIDSERPNLERRLRLWTSGPPPLPDAGCAHPRLMRWQLWCDAPERRDSGPSL